MFVSGSIKKLKDVDEIIMLSIDPGHSNMGISWTYYNMDSESFFIDDMDIWSFATKKTGNLEMIKRLTVILDSYKKYIETVDLIIIERQPGKALKKMIRIEQHLVTYFSIKYPHINIVSYVPLNRNKRKPDGINNRKWLLIEGLRIVEKYSSDDNVKKYRKFSSKQKTDVGAAILQSFQFIMDHIRT